MKSFIGLFMVLSGVAGIVWLSLPEPGSSVAYSTYKPDLIQPKITEPILIRALGYVEPTSEIRRLVFKIDGVIANCLVEIGQHVKKGDVLMNLRNEAEKAAVFLAEQELAVVTAERDQLFAGTPPNQIAAAEHRVELFAEHVRHAQVHFDRTSSLIGKKASSLQDRDQAETEVVRAKRLLLQAQAELLHLKNVVRAEDKLVAEAKVKRAEAQLQTAKERLADTFLRAPYDGVVLEILRREGEAPRLMDRDPVIVFADLSQLRVRAEVDERYVSSLCKGQQATIHGRGLGRQKYEGTVTLVKGVMGPKTVFSRDSSERKDLDIVQVLVDLSPDFQAPLGLQVDIDLVPARHN
jgi:HlyD family secretion protein